MIRHRSSGLRRAVWTALVLAGSLLTFGTAFAQSNAMSHQSDASLLASAQVPVAMGQALSAGGRFSITALEASGEAVLLTVSGVGLAASAVIVVSAELVRRLGIVAGTAVVAVAVSGGWILSAAGEGIAFVADAITRPFIHSTRISP